MKLLKRQKHQHSITAVANLAESATSRRVAIILNANARAVSDAVVQKIRAVLRPNETLFVSTSLIQARFIARQVVSQRYDVVLCGGGDGTFTRCVTDILALNPVHPPAFGVLRLGTGNALAETLDITGKTAHGWRRDLDIAGDVASVRTLPLLKVDGLVAPFAGVGMDATILEDYNAVKEQLQHTPLSWLGQGPAGYAVAVGSRSIWRYLMAPMPHVTIRNEGAPVRRIDLNGHAIGRPIPRGEIIYQGPVTLAAVSTIPFYGMGLKLFPQISARRDRFQLRVGKVKVHEVLPQIPTLFRGEFDHPQICDFHCTAISIHLQNASALQVGGDLVGLRENVYVGMTEVQTVAGPGTYLLADPPPVVSSEMFESASFRRHSG